MSTAKIQLSAEELQLVQNAQWLLTKNIIIEKVYTLFGELATENRQWVQEQPAFLPGEILLLSPKISRGEKYKGLPYVMLDYPRCFGKENVFAIRTFFWWGNFFSITLHLKGKYQRLLLPSLQKHWPLLSANHFQLSITGDEWEHDLNGGNFSPIQDSVTKNLALKLTSAAYIKLSCPVALSRWNDVNQILSRLHQVIFQAMAD